MPKKKNLEDIGKEKKKAETYLNSIMTAEISFFSAVQISMLIMCNAVLRAKKKGKFFEHYDTRKS